MGSVPEDIVLTAAIVGIILILGGLFMRFLAPRMRPNILVGARLGYSLKSRENWKATNRFTGSLFIASGVIIIALPHLLSLLGILRYFILSLFLIIGFVVVRSYLYSRKFYLEKELPKKGNSRSGA